MASYNNHDIPINYCKLQPKEAGVSDFYRILFSSGEKKDVDPRWLTFGSVLAQRLLMSAAEPLSSIGSKIEHCLNSTNDSSHTGETVGDPKESPTFLSTVGIMDTRVDLDKNIQPGDSKYYPALSAMASKISYENRACVTTTVRDRWKMELVGYYNFWNDFQSKHATQGFMVHDKSPASDMIIVSFRGTEPFNADDWCTDLDLMGIEIPKVGKVHGGFIKALGLQKSQSCLPKEIELDKEHPLAYYTIREKLREILRANNRTKFLVTGHSLGGALAILFVAILILHKEDELLNRLDGVYTFGQPRVGDSDFGNFMTDQLKEHRIKYLRIVYSNDLVPRLPMDDSIFLFKHFGTCIYYDSFYKAKIVAEEPNKNYFSLLAAIPKRVTAGCELLRSFVLPHIRGPDYEEGTLLKMSRAAGLIAPGISAHNPQNYVNATRLGSPDIFQQLQY